MRNNPNIDEWSVYNAKGEWIDCVFFYNHGGTTAAEVKETLLADDLRLSVTITVRKVERAS